jgi:antitoxin component YwqK of YwqJK toxin-antitoxin module
MRGCVFFSLVLLIMSCNDFTDNVIERYSDGTVKEVERFRGDKKVMHTQYYSNGKMKLQQNYDDTLAHGSYTMWYETGVIWVTGYAENGLNKVSIEFDEQGVKVVHKIRDRPNHLIVYTTFYSNGNKKFEINGIDKKVYTWHESGQLSGESANTSGEHKEFNLNGELEVLGYIKEGRLDSTWQFWDSTGILKKEIIYVLGVPIDSVVFSN